MAWQPASTWRRSPTLFCRGARAALTALALTVVVAGPAGAASASGAKPPALDAGGIGLQLVDIPAAAHSDPRAQLYIVDHLAPGTVIKRRIEVSNTTAKAAHVVLYAAGATIENAAFLGAAGHTPDDLSTWTSVVPAASDLPAGAVHSAVVTIAVPRDAAPGEQYAVVWAETSSPPVGGAISQISRVGIRLYLSVGPGGSPAADFSIDALTAKRSPGGKPIVVAAVHNTGGRALDMSGTLQLSAGPGGSNAGPFPAALGTTLAIGETEGVAVTLGENLPAGPWDARVTLRSGLLERTVAASITFPTAGAAAPVPTRRAGRPWKTAAIATVLAVVVLAGALAGLRRRRSVRS